MNRPRILFVDDEPNVLQGLRRMLHRQRNDWDLDFANGGEDALQLMSRSPYDIVVTDMRMPGMDGADLLSRVARQYPETVRFILSGHSDEAAILRSIPFTHQYLSKPCEPTELKNQLCCALALKQRMKDDHLRKMITEIDSLPSLPHLYQELRCQLQSEKVGLKDAAQTINRDIGMSAKVLQLVNSSFFGLSREITNVQQAVTILGIETLKALVLSVETFRELNLSTPLDGFSMTAFSEHSMQCGALAKQIVLSETKDREMAEHAFTAGMLHDLGKLILAAKLPERFRASLQQARAERMPLVDVEQRSEGCTHAEIGAYLTGLWRLPLPVTEAVAFHHHPESSGHEGMSPLLAVYVGNILTQEKTPGTSGNGAPPEFNPVFLEQAGCKDHLEKWRGLTDANAKTR